MKRLSFVVVLVLFLAGLGIGSRTFVPAVGAAAPVHQGDLILNGNNVTTLQDLHYFNGSIIVEENATLILRNAVINFTQVTGRQYNITLRNPVNGNPRLIAISSRITTDPSFDILTRLENNSTATLNNSTITSYIDAFEDSHLTITNSSTITTMYGYGQSDIEVSYSRVFEWHNYDSPTVHVHNSTINSLLIGSTSVNCTINKLQPALMSNWNFLANCTVTNLGGGYAPNVTLTNTTVHGWRLAFYGSSNAMILNSHLNEVSGIAGSSNIMLMTTSSDYAYADNLSALQIENSTIGQLQTLSSANASISHSKINAIQERDSSYIRVNTTTITTIQCYNSTQIDLLNSTYSNLLVKNNALAHVSWNLDVHVTDVTHQNVPNANVTAHSQNSAFADSKLTDSTGQARLILREKTINATGELGYGNYNVTVTYQGHSNQTSINMTENRQIALSLDFIIPEFTSIWLVLLILSASAVLAVTRRKNRSRGRHFQHSSHPSLS